MGDIHSKFKRAREIRCEILDAEVESPQNRTKKIINGLDKLYKGELNNWDGICFSVMYLASQLSFIPDLKNEVESLALKLMEAHYFSGGFFGLYDEDAINAKVRLKLELEGLNKKVEEHKTGD